MPIKKYTCKTMLGSVTGFDFKSGGKAVVELSGAELIDLMDLLIKNSDVKKTVSDNFEIIKKAFWNSTIKIEFKSMIAKRAAKIIPVPDK